MPNYLYSKDLKDAQEAADDINKFKDREMDNIKLYQSFKALATCTQNKHVTEIENPNNLSNKELDCDYD